MTPDNGDLDPATLAELRRLARSRPVSGRGALAKASAARTLERLSRGRQGVPPMPAGWHPGPPEFEELDRCDTQQTRERWWRNWWSSL